MAESQDSLFTLAKISNQLAYVLREVKEASHTPEMPMMDKALIVLLQPLMVREFQEEFDTHTKYVRGLYGLAFERNVDSESPITNILIVHLFLFYKEYVFRRFNVSDKLITENGIDLSMVNDALDTIQWNSESFGANYDWMLKGALSKLGYEITRMDFHEGAVKDARDMMDRIHVLLDSEKEIRSEAAKRVENTERLFHELEELNETIKDSKLEANFVRLDKALLGLKDQRSHERDSLVEHTTRMAAAMLIVPIVVLVIHFFIAKYWQKSDVMDYVVLAIPFISVEFLLIYFFRILYSQLASINTQIMQIDLRRSLIQFIESYADFSKEIKENNSSSLEKFEAIIFSNIVASDEKIPSTFDGIDQLASLLGSFKPGK